MCAHVGVCVNVQGEVALMETAASIVTELRWRCK